MNLLRKLLGRSSYQPGPSVEAITARAEARSALYRAETLHAQQEELSARLQQNRMRNHFGAAIARSPWPVHSLVHTPGDS